MENKKLALLGALFVAGTLLIPLGSKGMLGIALYIIAIHNILDHYQSEMNKYLKVLLSMIGGSLLTLIVATAFSFFQ